MTDQLATMLAVGAVLGAVAGVIGYLIAGASITDPLRLWAGEKLHKIRLDIPNAYGQIDRVIFDEPHSAKHKWAWKLLTCSTCVAWEAAIVETAVWAAVTGTGWVSFGVLAVAMATGRIVAR